MKFKSAWDCQNKDCDNWTFDSSLQYDPCQECGGAMGKLGTGDKIMKWVEEPPEQPEPESVVPELPSPGLSDCLLGVFLHPLSRVHWRLLGNKLKRTSKASLKLIPKPKPKGRWVFHRKRKLGE